MLIHDTDKIYQIIEIFRFGWTPDPFHPTYLLKSLFREIGVNWKEKMRRFLFSINDTENFPVVVLIVE